MEKVLYVASFGGTGAPAGTTERLRSEVGPALLAAGAHRVALNVADGDVAPAAGLRIASSAAPADAVVGVWVDSANDALRRPFDERIADLGGQVAAYLVTESVPMANRRPPSVPGARVEGMAQLAFLRRPEGQSVAEWLHLWLDRHTPLAIETQDTFGYVQHVVARVLTPGAPPWHAIVEELFPAAAMTDPHAFFDARGDDELLARRQQAMFESVQRFIDLAAIDVVPTSRYDLVP